MKKKWSIELEVTIRQQIPRKYNTTETEKV